VEPGIIKIFCLHIERDGVDGEGFSKNRLRLAGNRDDEFIVDRADYKEKKVKDSDCQLKCKDGTDEAEDDVYEMDLAFERPQSERIIRHHH